MTNKVLHVINSPGLGGAETVVKDIATHFPNHNVFCLRFDERNRFSCLEKRVVYGTYTGFYKFNPVVLYKLLSFIRLNKIELLHVHLANSLFYTICIKLLNPGINLIYHEHGEIFYNNKLRVFLKLLGRQVNLVLSVSDACRNEVNKYLPSQVESLTLKNYVDISQFNDIKHDYFQKPVVGFAGRLIYQKGCDVLLKAVQVSKNPWQLVMYGDGPYRNELMQLVNSLGIQDRVILLGYEPERKKIYQSAMIFVVPSRNEAASLGVVEARASGCIVIGSRVGGIPEYMEHGVTGFLFEKENSIELAKIIDDLISSSQLRVRISHNSLTEIKQYDILLYMQRLKEIYNSVLA